jgi:hypothetical protein
VFVAGCSTTYEVPPGKSTAMLTMSVDKPPLTGGSVHFFMVNTESCPNAGQSRILENYKHEPEDRKIEAGKDIYLRIYDNSPAFSYVPGYSCTVGVKFTPKAGERYEVKYFYRDSSCTAFLKTLGAPKNHGGTSNIENFSLIKVKDPSDMCGK